MKKVKYLRFVCALLLIAVAYFMWKGETLISSLCLITNGFLLLWIEYTLRKSKKSQV